MVAYANSMPLPMQKGYPYNKMTGYEGAIPTIGNAGPNAKPKANLGANQILAGFVKGGASGRKADQAENIPHIGSAKTDGASSAIDFIKKFDPHNLSGAIRPALDIMKKLLNNANPMNSLAGAAGGTYGALTSAVSQIQSATNTQTNPNPGPNVNDPCTLYDTTGMTYVGSLQYANNILTCVVTNPPPNPPGPLSPIDPVINTVSSQQITPVNTNDQGGSI